MRQALICIIFVTLLGATAAQTTRASRHNTPTPGCPVYSCAGLGEVCETVSGTEEIICTGDTFCPGSFQNTEYRCVSTGGRRGEACAPYQECQDTPQGSTCASSSGCSGSGVCSFAINGSLSVCTDAAPIRPGLPCTENLECAPVYLNYTYAVLSCANGRCFGIADNQSCYADTALGCLEGSTCVRNQASTSNLGVCSKTAPISPKAVLSAGERCNWTTDNNCRSDLSCYPTDNLGNGTCRAKYSPFAAGGLCSNEVQCGELEQCNFNSSIVVSVGPSNGAGASVSLATDYGYCMPYNNTESLSSCSDDSDCQYGEYCECIGVSSPRCILRIGNRPGSSAASKVLDECVLDHSTECNADSMYDSPCTVCEVQFCDYMATLGAKEYYTRIRSYFQKAIPSCAQDMVSDMNVWREYDGCGWWNQSTGATGAATSTGSQSTASGGSTAAAASTNSASTGVASSSTTKAVSEAGRLLRPNTVVCILGVFVLTVFFAV